MRLLYTRVCDGRERAKNKLFNIKKKKNEEKPSRKKKGERESQVRTWKRENLTRGME
jgi:hypothetical protein